MPGGIRQHICTVLVATTALFAAACTADGTHLVAWIESDLQPCAELASVDVEARREGGGLLGTRRLDRCAETLRFPGLVQLTPRDPADARRLVVTARGAAGYRLRQEYGDCDAAAFNGCEVDLNAGAAHCGACGRACPLVL